MIDFQWGVPWSRESGGGMPEDAEAEEGFFLGFLFKYYQSEKAKNSHHVHPQKLTEDLSPHLLTYPPTHQTKSPCELLLVWLRLHCLYLFIIIFPAGENSSALEPPTKLLAHGPPRDPNP